MERTPVILEQDLVPYSTSPLPPGPWIILAPHPDDETIGMGGTIAMGARAGKLIHVVFITDGGIGGAPEVRRQEARKALTILGVRSYKFLDLPDRRVHNLTEVLAKKIIAEMEKIKPYTVFAPSIMEFHPDHRATTQALLKALLKKVPEHAVWLYEISRQSEVNALVNISSVIEIKKEAISCYYSQLAQNDYLDTALSLNRLRAYTLSPQGIRWCEGFWTGKACTIVKALKERLLLYTKLDC